MSRRVDTLASIWPGYAVRRRQLGLRDWKNDESRWDLYIGPDSIAAVPLKMLGRRHAKAWLARMGARGLAPQTIKNALNLLRGACADAIDSELLTGNPCDGLRLPRSSRPQEGWTVLDPDEQLALLRVIEPDSERDMITVELHTGLRNSELWRLEPGDVDTDAREIVVRYSRGGRGTKGGRVRRVPLFGVALIAAERALDRARRSGSPVLFPSPRTGERRYDSSQPHRWHDWIEAAGIKRRVRFYDLRHTCATSLLAGWWGRKWSVDEVRQLLGHSSIGVTERYAHLVDDTLRRAGRATSGVGTDRGTKPRANSRDRTGDLRFTNSSGLQGFQLLALRDHYDRHSRRDDQLAAAVLDATRLLLCGARVADVRRALRPGVAVLAGESARSRTLTPLQYRLAQAAHAAGVLA